MILTFLRTAGKLVLLSLLVLPCAARSDAYDDFRVDLIDAVGHHAIAKALQMIKSPYFIPDDPVPGNMGWLGLAAQAGEREVFTAMLDAGSNPNPTSPLLNPAGAAMNVTDDLWFMQTLFKRGADPNWGGANGWGLGTALVQNKCLTKPALAPQIFELMLNVGFLPDKDRSMLREMAKGHCVQLLNIAGFRADPNLTVLDPSIVGTALPIDYTCPLHAPGQPPSGGHATPNQLTMRSWLLARGSRPPQRATYRNGYFYQC